MVLFMKGEWKMEVFLLLIIILLLCIYPLVIKNLFRNNLYKTDANIQNSVLEKFKYDFENSNTILRKEVSDDMQRTINSLGNMMIENQKSLFDLQTKGIKNNGDTSIKHIESMNNAMTNQILTIEKRLETSAVENENKLEGIRKNLEIKLSDMSDKIDNRLKISSEASGKQLEQIRKTVETKLSDLQKDNNEKLDKMQGIVDEKLQKTLEDRITKSFAIVNKNLEDVYKGIGEMQSLATGVGDLKKVLSNVKTRGILGEIQLGAILSEILAPEQYKTNFITKKGGKEPVEYAIKLPTDDGSGIYLPVDSKFPGDSYSNLVKAYENGNKIDIDNAAKELVRRIKSEAKDISDKYIDPPNTTDFAIMFLPFEGLYSEVVNRGLVEELQNVYRVNIAGPSTMAALLNSLQMGFKTFAIQKRSSEVWKVLGAVKTEFNNFEKILKSTQDKLLKANDELDKLVGVRTRAIQRKLKNVESLDTEFSEKILDSELGDYDN